MRPKSEAANSSRWGWEGERLVYTWWQGSLKVEASNGVFRSETRRVRRRRQDRRVNPEDARRVTGASCISFLWNSHTIQLTHIFLSGEHLCSGSHLSSGSNRTAEPSELDCNWGTHYTAHLTHRTPQLDIRCESISTRNLFLPEFYPALSLDVGWRQKRQWIEWNIKLLGTAIMFFFDYDLMGKLYDCVSSRAFADDKMLVEAFYRIRFCSLHRTHKGRIECQDVCKRRDQ